MTKTFALIGAAGYIAPRHMRAIRDTGNDLVVAMDPNDSVGIIDSHFPEAAFFVDFERFDAFLQARRPAGGGAPVDVVAVCSPNDLHETHMAYGLRLGSDVICEKPLVLDPDQIDTLMRLEAQSAGRVSTILQLRLHPSIVALKQAVAATDRHYDITLTYITSRGRWYHQSWKGDVRRSGGIATNIGVHFFDMIHWIFGDARESVVHHRDASTAAGRLELSRASIRWFLSIDDSHLPPAIQERGQRTYRSIVIDDEELEFSGGFTDLHTTSYQEALAGRGFGLAENIPAIRTTAAIRDAQPVGRVGEYHPILRNV